jgi:4-amino-4-deoxy-L-arabinose transferase-like glycosyltransferase
MRVEEGAGRPRLFWIVLLALILRFAVGLLLLPDRMNPRRDHYVFDYEVGKVAASLATGHGFSDPYYSRGAPPAGSDPSESFYYQHTGPSAMEPPVFVGLLAGIFVLFGLYSKASAVVALFVNCLFSALTVLPIYGIAKKCFSPRVAIWSAWLYAFFPFSVFWAANYPWATPLTTLLFAACVLKALQLEQNDRIRTWFLVGLLAGFTALVDPVVLATLPFVGAWLCYRRAKSGRAWLLPAAAAAAALIIPLAPWVARNYVVFDHALILRDSFWLPFRVSNSPDTISWWDDSKNPDNNPAEMREVIELGELQYMQAKKRQAIEFVRQRPGFFISLVARKAVYMWTGFWSFRREYLETEPFDLPNIPFNTAFTILALLGLWKMFRERHPMRWLFIWILLTLPALYYLTIPMVRYRGPADPYVIILSSYAVVSWLDARREARRKLDEVSATPIPAA